MYKVQYAFNLSMIMCSAIHMATRSLLRSSSTHEPSDPLSRVSLYMFFFHNKIITYTKYIMYMIRIKIVFYLGVGL
jgi:hypothetical protein